MRPFRAVVQRVLAENAAELAEAAGATLTAEAKRHLDKRLAPVVEAVGDGLTASVAAALAGGRVQLDVEAALALVLRRSGPGAVELLRRVLAQVESARSPRAQGKSARR